MVEYAYDLSPRQSSRIIEQSILNQSSVWAETIQQSYPHAVHGTLRKAGDDTIIIHLREENMDVSLTTGQYYQLVISLEDVRYLTVSDLLEVQQGEEGRIMRFSKPKNLQVMQRRSRRRMEPDNSTPVYISWQQDELNSSNSDKTPAFGQIKEISAHGISVRVASPLNESLFIGDEVYLRFTPNVREGELFTPASICHKELDEQKSELILGLQFIRSKENVDFNIRLNQFLKNQKKISTKDI